MELSMEGRGRGRSETKWLNGIDVGVHVNDMRDQVKWRLRTR